MDNVIARLRASDRESTSQFFEQGREAGIEWANGQAEAGELRRLSKVADSLRTEPRFDWSGWLSEFFQEDPQYAFVKAIRPIEYGDDQNATDDFWQEVLGDDTSLIDESAFVHGFADGATDVWAEVANKL